MVLNLSRKIKYLLVRDNKLAYLSVIQLNVPVFIRQLLNIYKFYQ